jgi:predicted NBD/HSP70 family sugar kinase
MTSSAGDQRFLRRLNASAVLAALREDGPRTLRELSVRTGLSRPTVEAVLGALGAEGWVAALAPEEGGMGRPARRYRFRAEAGSVLGIDIGAHRVRVLVADLDGAVQAQARVPVDVSTGRRARLAAVRRGLDEAGVGSVAAAGVGTPGLVARDGRVTISVLPQWSGLELAAAVGRLVDCPVAAENDANLAVLAERWQGAARADDDVVFVLLEQGIGAGVLLGGRLHRGHHGAAGEIAYGDFLGGLGSLRELGHELVDAARAGDERAIAAIAGATPHIARHVSALALAYDPALVVIGGGLSRASDRFVPEIEAALARACVVPPRLAVSATGGEAVALGAVRLALDAAHARLFG